MGPYVATTVYLVTLVLSMSLSAAYNIWPISPIKRFLRRFDHSAIYLLIAGTYTPFMAKSGTWWLLAGVWAIAIVGVLLKFLKPDRFDRLSIALYLATWLERRRGLSGIFRRALRHDRLAHSRRWRGLFARRYFPHSGEVALSQRDMARICAGRCQYSLCSGVFGRRLNYSAGAGACVPRSRRPILLKARDKSSM